MKNCYKPMVCRWRSFIKPALVFLFVVTATLAFVSCNKERGFNQFHIQGQLVELGTNMPLRHAGVKFIIFKSEKSSPLVSAVHIPVDSFETDANGQYDHVFKTPELLENFKVKVVGTIPGYYGNANTYNFSSSANELKKMHLVRIVPFTFRVDNRNGNEEDSFIFHMSGMIGFAAFTGKKLHSFQIQQGAFSHFTINFGNWQTDSSYLIPIFIDSLESYTYTHVIDN